MKRVFTRRYKEFTSQLRAARERAQLTQIDMADRLDTKQTVISKIERSERRLDVLEFLDWCQAANTDPCKILRAITRIDYQAERKGKR